MLYALGEILLVMVGILLALQVNNWNEWRKERVEEKNILVNFKRDLTSDIENHFNKHLLRSESDMKKAQELIDHASNGRPYHDSLRFHFGVLSATGGKDWTPQMTAYERLKSKGLDVIRNDSLLNSILDIYNIDYPRITHVFENYLRNVFDYGRPIVRRKLLGIKREDAWSGLIPIDYASLRKHPEFLNTLRVLEGNSRQINGHLIESKSNVETVITLINEELAK